MSKKDEGRLWPVAYVFLFFLTAGVILWQTLKMPSYLFLMGIIGVFAALGFYLHRTLSRRKKTIAHTISLLAIGAGLFFGAGVFGRQNEQLEGFFFDLLLGLVGGALVNYLVAKIIGPLVVGRLWCGWGCWTFAFLNLLPFKRSKGKAKEAPYSVLRTVFFPFILWPRCLPRLEDRLRAGGGLENDPGASLVSRGQYPLFRPGHDPGLCLQGQPCLL